MCQISKSQTAVLCIGFEKKLDIMEFKPIRSIFRSHVKVI